MRLTPEEVAAIKQATAEVFGPSAVVRLFGSRVDDSKRGGDIDLYIEADPDRVNVGNELRVGVRLEDLLGERKIDVILHAAGRPRRPIAQIAVDTGIVL